MSQWQPEQYDPGQHQRRIYGQPQPYPPQMPQPYPPQPPWQQPGYGQPPQPPAPQPQPPKAKGSSRTGCLLLLGLAAVIGIAAAVLSHHGGGPSPWKAHVADTAVINPADLAVTLKITNTGSSAATPTCTVDAQDPSGAYSGVNEGSLSSPVQPGQTVTTVMDVTITSQGAQYVTQVTVSC